MSIVLDNEVLDFVERIDGHKTAGALLDDLLTTVRGYGFDHLIYTGVPVGGQKMAPLVELNGWPAGWYQRYCAQDHSAYDAVSLYSARTLRPFQWDEIPAPFSDTDLNRLVIGEAAEFGIRSGFAVPMLSVSHWQSVLSFASAQPRCELSPRARGQLVTMAVMVGGAVQAMMDEHDEVELSEREKEVLLWAAAGKSAWEISKILSISERTVNFHLESTRQKLGVAKTVQAIVEAVRRRLIHP